MQASFPAAPMDLKGSRETHNKPTAESGRSSACHPAAPEAQRGNYFFFAAGFLAGAAFAAGFAAAAFAAGFFAAGFAAAFFTGAAAFAGAAGFFAAAFAGALDALFAMRNPPLACL